MPYVIDLVGLFLQRFLVLIELFACRGEFCLCILYLELKPLNRQMILLSVFQFVDLPLQGGVIMQKGVSFLQML